MLLFTILGLIGFFNDASAQFKKNIYLEWEKPTLEISGDKISVVPRFVDQQNSDANTGLPLMLIELALLNWDEDNGTVSVDLLDQLWADEITLKGEIPQEIGWPPMLRYNIVYEEGQPVLKVWLMPLLINLETKTYKQLLTASLQVDYVRRATGAIGQSRLKAQSSYASQSVLSKGKWVKISVKETGVHRIPYSKLSSWGFANPEKVRVFGQGGVMLPRLNADTMSDDLMENSVWHQNNSIYFFAHGPVTWSYNSLKGMFVHTLHNYSDKGYYYLSEEGAGLLVNDKDLSSLTPNFETSEFDDFAYHEAEKVNILGSGISWYGERFGPTSLSSFTKNFDFPNTVISKQGRISTEFAARSNLSSDFKVFLNGNTTASQSVVLAAVDLSSETGYYARDGRSTVNFIPTGDRTGVSVKYNFNSNSSTADGYLDKINIQVRRQLRFVGPQMMFRDRETVATERISRFNITTSDGAMVVWDVSKPIQPQRIVLSGTENTRWFAIQTAELKEFVAFLPTGNLPTPEFVENVENQNLHALPQVDYIIVSAQDFFKQAQRLASLHQTYNNLSVVVVTQNQVFNEFSSGSADISAIRNFVKMFYDRAGTNASLRPKYLLLFGDGIYDNRNGLGTNRIITFQSDSSLEQTGTYVSDDYFGFLDNNEGANPQSDGMDIGVGRFPASTISEATVLVNKSELYMLSQNNGNWRTRIAFIGDDGDGNTHMRQAELLANKVEFNHPEFNLNKIYFDSYPRITTSSGQRYPDVNTLVDNVFVDGALIFNYTGHGGNKGLAHERIVTTESIKRWSNIDRMPLFMTATCEFSSYDQENTSAGEMVLLNPKGGGIALLSTTRIVYSSQNFDINNSFFSYALQKDAAGLPMRLGDISKLTKRSTPGSVNKLNFSLLGDPGLRLATTSLLVGNFKLNNKDLSVGADTLKALSLATITGEILNNQRQLVSNFNGTANITVFDKQSEMKTLGNGGTTPFVYNTFPSIIFSGRVIVENGRFTSTFMVPKDISLNYGNGRISVYANSDNLHATGFTNEVIVGGFVQTAIDDKGPDIQLYLNDSDFVNGGIVGSTPLLIAQLYDLNGINTSSSGIGHDIVLQVNDGFDGRYILNSYFESTLNSHQSGKIQFQIPELPEGEHRLTLKAWDTHNNSNEVTINFKVTNSKKLSIKQNKLYPNPVKQGQNITFKLEHNDPNSAIEATGFVYSIGGTLLGQQKQILYSNGIVAAPMTIRTTTDNGIPLGKGIYVLRIDLLSETGKKATVSQKIVVIE